MDTFEARAEAALQEILKASEVLENKYTKLEERCDQIEDLVGDGIRAREAKRHGLLYGPDVLAAIPESQRRGLEAAERIYRDMPEEKLRGLPFPKNLSMKFGMGLWFQNQLRRYTRPADFDREAQAKLTEGLGGVHKVALQEDTAGEGAEFVPTAIQAEILRLIADNGVMRRVVRQVPMTTKVHQYPTRANPISAAIIAEEGTITDSIPGSPFSNASLTAKKLAAFATVSGELMQDNVVLLADFLATEFAEQMARLEDAQALEGDGSGLNFTGVVAASGVASVSSGANGDRVYFSKLYDTCFAAQQQSAIASGALFMHPLTWKAILQARTDAVTAADGKGLPLVQDVVAGIGGSQRRFGGFPVFLSTAILTNRTVGTGTNRTNLYFGPPQSIIFGDLLNFRIDLNPYSKFSTYQIDVRGIARTGILVGVPSAWTKYTGIDNTLTMA